MGIPEAMVVGSQLCLCRLLCPHTCDGVWIPASSSDFWGITQSIEGRAFFSNMHPDYDSSNKRFHVVERVAGDPLRVE